MKSMNRSDGIKLASAAAALMLTGCGGEISNAQESASNGEGPVKVAQCEGVEGAEGLVSISSGNDNFSSVLCQVAGGTAVNSLTMAPGEHITGAPAELTYCNDVFTCAGLSACKGNDNAACAGQNDCHAIGFVGVYSSDKSLSDELCEKLGGTILTSI